MPTLYNDSLLSSVLFDLVADKADTAEDGFKAFCEGGLSLSDYLLVFVGGDQ